MAYHFHQNRKLYFEHQCQNALTYVIPFIRQQMQLTAGMKVLEVGCGEGGVLKAFLNEGLYGVGVELTENKYERSLENLAGEIEKGQCRIIHKNIYDPSFETEFAAAFDLIVLKDVIEHIPDQERILRKMKTFLKSGGQIYFGFPPWYMPFGGHQQIAKTKASKLPWLHVLPNFLYLNIYRAFGETEEVIGWLENIKSTRITIEQFEHYARCAGYSISAKKLYLINPIYKYKFKLKPRRQLPVLDAIPWFRNFYTTCAYYLIKPL